MRDLGKIGLRNIAKALAQKLGVEDQNLHGPDSMTNSSVVVNELPISAHDSVSDMDSGTEQQRRAERLKKARIKAGYDSASDAARALNIPLPTYLAHENGTTKFTRKLETYARKFNVSADHLLTGKSDTARTPQSPVVAYIGAGAEVFPLDDHPKGRGFEMVAPPSGLAGDFVAAKIKGDSMHPLKEGWLVFWSKDHDGVTEECLGQLCVVKLVDGSMWLKDLRKGTRKGFYNLESWNGPTREDVEVEWASPVRDIRPR